MSILKIIFRLSKSAHGAIVSTIIDNESARKWISLPRWCAANAKTAYANEKHKEC